MVMIKCESNNTVSLDDLQILQGDLKLLSNENYLKLKSRILKDGFITPFFIWDDNGSKFLIDGTQRYRALQKMKIEGLDIPAKYPCVLIEAKNKMQAIERILAISSSFGVFDSLGAWELLQSNNIDYNVVNCEYNLVRGDFEINPINFDTDAKEGVRLDEVTHMKKLKTCPECGYEF